MTDVGGTAYSHVAANKEREHANVQACDLI